MNKLWIGILLFAGIVVLSLIDLGITLLGFIPLLGDALKTASETAIELIQILLVGIGFFVLGLVDGD